jgi:hypothetical protein
MYYRNPSINQVCEWPHSDIPEKSGSGGSGPARCLTGTVVGAVYYLTLI